MSDDLKTELKKISHLYKATGTDWLLNISHIVTEPVCPVVWLTPEDNSERGWGTAADTIEDGVRTVVAKALERYPPE